MKTLFLFSCLAALVVSLNACNKNSVDPSTTDASARSGGVVSTSVTGPHNLTTVDVASLPAAITTYITTTYAGATIKEAKKDAQGNYSVVITVNSIGKLLLFKADGTFVKEADGKPNHAPGDSARHEGKGAGPGSMTVAVSSLPAAITSYINTNYAGATVKEAFKGPDGGFLVAITQNNVVKLLLFKADGTFVQAIEKPAHAPGDTTHHPRPGQGSGPQATTIAASSLPAAVTTYINTNYAGSTIEKAAQDKTTSDYLVAILTTDKKRVLLLFGSDGTFKKAHTGR